MEGAGEEVSYYAVLSVPKDAPDSLISQAYRRLAQTYHPGQLPTTQPQAGLWHSCSRGLWQVFLSIGSEFAAPADKCLEASSKERAQEHFTRVQEAYEVGVYAVCTVWLDVLLHFETCCQTALTNSALGMQPASACIACSLLYIHQGPLLTAQAVFCFLCALKAVSRCRVLHKRTAPLLLS